MQINRRYRALVPKASYKLQQQILCTPKYLKDNWIDTLGKSYKMKPRIILINDDERLLTLNRSCNVYVQCIYENESIKGIDPLYQYILPDTGPVSPTRPILVTPRSVDRLDKKINKNPLAKPVPKPRQEPGFALREAPVYVYHKNGSAFYENVAQYLTGNHPQLSPRTARKILQFADMKEFEDYLAAKVTRDEAMKIAEQSGKTLINVQEVKNTLMKINEEKDAKSVYYHLDCENDPLRLNLKKKPGIESNEIEVGGKIVKSTFIGFDMNGDPKKVEFEDLPNAVIQNLPPPIKIEPQKDIDPKEAKKDDDKRTKSANLKPAIKKNPTAATNKKLVPRL